MQDINKPCEEECSSAMQGYIHSIETAGAVDGPGVRYVVFTTGCPLRCAYCHNPDSQRLKQGRRVTVHSILEDIASYKSYLQATHGGVTISGGEPLVQPEFVKSILRGCKKMGLHTALDTSGFLGADADDEFLTLTDLVLLDIKSGIPSIYKDVTGVDLQPTLDFARRLNAIGKKIWVRYVLVPNLTDGEENIKKVADFCASLQNVERVEVLPFHKMGEQKWADLQMTYRLKNTPEPTEMMVEAARDIFRAMGMTAVY